MADEPVNNRPARRRTRCRRFQGNHQQFVDVPAGHRAVEPEQGAGA